MNRSEVSDYPGGFVIVKTEFGRMHLFASEARDEIFRKIQEIYCFVYPPIHSKKDTFRSSAHRQRNV